MWEMEAHSFFDQRRKKIQEHKRKREEWFKAHRFQFKRISAEVRPVAPWGSKPETLAARLFNLDLGAYQVRLFCSARVAPGQEVEFTVLENDGKFYVRGVVESCQRMNLTQTVQSETDFNYRITVKYKFRSRDEFDQTQEYVERFLERHVRYGQA